MDQRTLRETIQDTWRTDALASLSEFVTIPALSPAFDALWASNGHLHAAVEHMRAWLAARDLPGAVVEVVKLPGRTPLLLLEIPATGATTEDTVVLYGHLDKQPAAGEWSPGLDPWTPVVKDGRLYGRGAGDDGYAGYAAATALEALHRAGGRHARTVVLLETCEESGSPDLATYLDHLRDRIGRVGLVVCLDVAGGDYERLWLATSLRGIAFLDLTVRVLDSGVHSGHSSGLVPSSFRVVRQLLDRLEDSRTGEVLLPELSVEIPEDRLAEVRLAVAEGGLRPELPITEGVRTASDDPVELVLNNTWRTTLSVTGASGLPSLEAAGNVLRPFTGLKLSFRLPPTADAEVALEAIVRTLTTDVPYDAKVEIGRAGGAAGWNAPKLAPWLATTLDKVSVDVFGEPWRALGLGGTIPFLGLFAEAYPDAQFVVTGPRGPGNNAHVPDEWLHLEQTERVTEAVARILHAHAGE
ncbi:M20/M25/M40 family metallo-hydrolase [Amycolatopsis sp. 195334CR]|uniref:M20/M25/M40 family metallo-hydrolase n=1 Tax=Amycolatopsis sp. 195334CR TaxID=2814588 RepID=UPI001A8C4642|nr:M20/M25/M40 family metallo-hydrolase [Amycolatopsis sp. 195334CR]MBN6035746.1 M20/M25/M40 family metallo-hydrolase [Amycolatopsis sp. 195334CR]